MDKQPLDDGGWFDLDTATRYDENTTWDGNNAISLATGDQWEHEDLYRTGKGGWVLRQYSNWQGVLDKWVRVSDEDAARWLIRNQTQLPDELAEHASALEV